MKLNEWDHALNITADGKGLIGRGGAVLLRKAADQLGLTTGLAAALRQKGTRRCWTGARCSRRWLWRSRWAPRP